MTNSKVRRITPLAALTLSALLIVTACSDNTETPDPSPTVTSPTSGTKTPTGAKGQPLSAADLPGWTVTADVDDFTLCGEPSTLSAKQSKVDQVTFRSPTGIIVHSQVAEYSDNPVVALKELAAAAAKCPLQVTDSEEISTRTLTGPPGVEAVGIEVTRRNIETGVRNVTVYWAAITGAGTVEVTTQTELGVVADVPLNEFALHVLAAARAKALGNEIETVISPQVPAVTTWADQEPDSGDEEQTDTPTEVPDGPPVDLIEVPGSNAVDPFAPGRPEDYNLGDVQDAGEGAETGFSGIRNSGD